MPLINPFASAAPAPSEPVPGVSSGTALVNPFASRAGEEEQGGEGLFALPGNILSGVGDIVGGAVGLLGAGVHDVVKAGAAILPGQQAPDKTGWRMDDVAKGLVGFSPSGKWDPAKYGISGDLWRRYSPVLPGGPPAHETWWALQNEPVSFALDALTVATAGATAGASVGSAALKGTASASKAASVAADLGKAGFSARAATRAGIRAGLDDLASTRALTATEAIARRMMPTQTLSRVGNKLVPSVTAVNPLTRVTTGALFRRLSTEPIAAISKRVDDLKTQIDTELAAKGATVDELGTVGTMVASKSLVKTVTEYRVQKAMLDEAEAAGISRLATPKWSDRSVSWAARRLTGDLNGEFLMRRQGRQAKVVQTLRPWLEKHPEISKKAAGIWQRLDIDIAGKQSAHWAGRSLEFEGIGSVPVTMAIGAPPPLRLTLDAAVRAGADPRLLKRTDDLVEALNATRQKWMEDPRLPELGYNVADEVDALDRIIDHLHDAVDRRVQHDQGSVPSDPTLLAMDDMRLLNLEESMGHWRDPGLLSPTQILDRAYLPLRAKYGAKMDIDGTLSGGPATKALDDTLRAQGQAAPIYFPHMDPGEIGAWEFFRSRKPVGAAKLAEDPSLKRNLAKLLERGDYITDPMEAYTRRAARAVRAEETYRTMMSFSKRLGRRIDKADELGVNEVLFAPDLLRIQKRTASVQDLVDDMTSSGLSREESIWRAVESITEANTDEIAAMLGARRPVELYAVPRAAADRLQDAAKYASLGGKAITSYFDSGMQAWRQLTLFTRPAYVVNQFLGNTAFAILQGSGIRTPLAILTRRLNQKLFGTDKVLARIEDLPGYEELGQGLFGSLNDNYLPRNASIAGTRAGRGLARAGQTRIARGGKHWLDIERKAAAEIDMAYRVSGYVTAAERAMGLGQVRRTIQKFKGLQRRIDDLLKGGLGDDPAVITQALKEAKLYFGDYSAMGAFERHVVRRYLFPWWGFTRHNLRLIAKFPLDNPLRAEVLRIVDQLDADYKDQYGDLPNWLDTQVPIGPPGAEVPFFSLRGGSPFEFLSQNPLTQLGPVPKIALERAMGRNLYMDRPFTDEDVITPYGSTQPFQIIRDEAGNVTDVVPLEGDVLPGLVEHVLSQFPPYSYAKQIAASGARPYDTATLLGLLQGKDIMRDETGAPLNERGRAAVIGSWLGVPVTEYDIKSFQDRMAKEREAALTSAQSRIVT